MQDLIDRVVTLDKDLIVCDAYMNTSDPNIFAAGDSCSYPNITTGERVIKYIYIIQIHFAHYISAQQQGSIAALNMIGNKKVLYEYVPFFWTRHWDKSLQFVGYISSYDEVYIDGDLEELKFKAYYIKSNKVIAFSAMNSPNSANIMYEAFRNKFVPSARSFKSGEMTIEKLKEVVKTRSKCSKITCLCTNKINI